MSNHSAGLEIKAYRSKRVKQWLLVLLLFSVLTVGYLLGHQRAGERLQLLPQQIERQQLALDEQRAQVYELKLQRLRSIQEQKIHAAAITEVRALLKEQQQASLELREEIAFYRGIVSPSGAKSGTLIQRLEIVPLAAVQLFHYQLVLTQVLKNERVTRGVVEITLSGVLDGSAHRLSLQEVDDSAKKTLNYRFKYFQKFEGDLRLPDGFAPRSIEVVVKPQRGGNTISESFSWPEVVVEER